MKPVKQKEENDLLKNRVTELEHQNQLLRNRLNQINDEGNRYKLLTESSPFAFYETDKNGNCTYVNKMWQEHAGLNFEEALGDGWQDALHEDDKEEVFTQWKKNASNALPWSMEYRFKNKQGKITWIFGTSHAIRNNKNEITGYIGMNLDITERKTFELELQKSESAFKSLAEQLPSTVFTTNEEGTILFINRTIKPLSTESITGMNFRDFIPKGDEIRIEGFIEEVRKTKQPIQYETQSSNIFGNHWFDVRIGPRYEHNKFGGFIFILTDISASKKVELELNIAKERAEESDKLKTAFLANMSHEIRTPLNGIMGFAGLLSESENLSPEKQNKFLTVIQKSGERMLNITNDLIDISKIESGQMELQKEKFDLLLNLNQLYQLFKKEAKNKNLELYFEPDNSFSDLKLFSDKKKLTSIVSNLIKNALKFTLKGEIRFGYKVVNDTIKFYVSDTGLGVPEHKRSIIFDRFVQGETAISRPYEGAGLGLAITKAYVEMLGGKIDLISEENVGSTFSFYLPKKVMLTQERPTSVSSQKEDETSILNNKSVLIVEDDQTSFLLLNEMIKDASLKVYHAQAGSDAVTYCKSYNPDLILMDIKLPDMDGYQATKEIRQFDNDVKIIAQTAFALAGDKEKAIEAGCNAHISKPIRQDFLFAKIHELFP